MRETKAAERINVGLSAKLAMALCALVVTVGLVPALAPQAHAAEGPKFVGAVEYRPSYDENGYPEYNADGTLKRDKAYVSLYDIENASGIVQVPDVFDVVVRDKQGNESVVKDVTPYYLYLSYENRDNVSVGWENSGVTGVDLSRCASLTGVGCYVKTIESLDVHGLSRLESMYLGSCEALKSLVLAGTRVKRLSLWE